jgi:hypothetical protein
VGCTEWLTQHYWEGLEEVWLAATQWMYDYIHHRPNMALGRFAPKQRLATVAWFYLRQLLKTQGAPPHQSS